MFGTKARKPQNRIDCLIGAGTRVEGNVIFSGGLRIDGDVRGSIVAEEGKPGTLVVSERAHIEGEIRAPHVVINGAVRGPVTSTEYVELQAKANVTGDVYYNTLEMQVGAVVQGRLIHDERPGSDKVVPLKQPATEPNPAPAATPAKS
jgi:cytoskeletal protein CcmA (bactofilin family)